MKYSFILYSFFIIYFEKIISIFKSNTTRKKFNIHMVLLQYKITPIDLIIIVFISHIRFQFFIQETIIFQIKIEQT